ncbi:hypothetical protein CK203_046027 [Vitis vinifera]|uniref:Uncharacterized protein n=1 Tax=Vitis vinifera TaxID=29760 RepID=A0A438HGY2_VITVI|nr:hypothetical protein CK203_046027 [Vitis vinifera]
MGSGRSITVNNNNKEWERGSMLAVTQEAREERENGWEECNLAKFSQFLGFSTEGSIGVGRFLDWRAWMLRTAGGILVCWDKRLLELLDGRRGNSLFLAGLGRWKMAVWVFTGVYGRSPKMKGTVCGMRLGLSEDYGKNPAMRKFAQVIDELGLIDLPLQGVDSKKTVQASFGPLPGGLEGGTVRRGPSPFRFENMWLKVEGFQELIHSWWQGIEVRGSASFRLATKMKAVKQKLKVWNREVFGRLEDNKAAALQLVDHWDRWKVEKTIRGGNNQKRKQRIVMLSGFFGGNSLEAAFQRIMVKGRGQNTGYFHRMVAAIVDSIIWTELR